jgi:hypothetical protein
MKTYDIIIYLRSGLTFRYCGVENPIDPQNCIGRFGAITIVSPDRTDSIRRKDIVAVSITENINLGEVSHDGKRIFKSYR